MRHCSILIALHGACNEHVQATRHAATHGRSAEQGLQLSDTSVHVPACRPWAGFQCMTSVRSAAACMQGVHPQRH